MRRKDRKITDFKTIQTIFTESQCCRLGLYDGHEVYIVPLNYGIEFIDDTPVLYFHGAKTGRKLQILNQNPHVGFEIDHFYGTYVKDNPGQSMTSYQSIIGNGVIHFIEDLDEKKHAFNLLMNHYTDKQNWNWNESMLNSVIVFRLEITKYCAKQANRRSL